MGSYGQDSVHNPFYDSLVKPGLQPPDWVFGVVWPILFVLLGMAAYYAWNYYTVEWKRKIFTILYLLNGLLMMTWSDQFFVKGSLTNGLYAMIGLVVIVEMMIIAAFYTNKKSGYLLLPYLLWILFAAYLNVSYVVLNS